GRAAVEQLARADPAALARADQAPLRPADLLPLPRHALVALEAAGQRDAAAVLPRREHAALGARADAPGDHPPRSLDDVDDARRAPQGDLAAGQLLDDRRAGTLDGIRERSRLPLAAEHGARPLELPQLALVAALDGLGPLVLAHLLAASPSAAWPGEARRLRP